MGLEFSAGHAPFKNETCDIVGGASQQSFLFEKRRIELSEITTEPTVPFVCEVFSGVFFEIAFAQNDSTDHWICLKSVRVSHRKIATAAASLAVSQLAWRNSVNIASNCVVFDFFVLRIRKLLSFNVVEDSFQSRWRNSLATNTP